MKRLGPLKDNRQHHHSVFGDNRQRDQKKSRQTCLECKKQHSNWRRNQFKLLDVKNCWISAKKDRLTHNRLLRDKAVVQKAEDKNQPIDDRKSSTQTRGISVRGLVSITE